MAVFYRIEKDGIGPFQSRDVPEVLSEELDRYHENMDTPLSDTYLYGTVKEWDWKFLCAYKSLEDLHKWIQPHLLKQLISIGFNIVEIEAGLYKVGKDQVIFHPHFFTSKIKEL